MALLAIQQAFSQAIYANNSTALQQKIISDEQFSAIERIRIYRNNTLGTLQAVLQSVYPICTQLVGQRYFQQLATYHVQHHPSKQRNLDQYGGSFPQTLLELITIRPELQQYVYLADMAQLEWHLNSAYYANNRASFDFSAFAALSPEQQLQLRFILAEDINLMTSDYPLFAIWQSHQIDDNFHESKSKSKSKVQGNIDWQQQWQDQSKQYLLILREKWQATVILIEPALYRLLEAFKAQKPLMILNDYLAASPVELSELIKRQWITGFLE